MPPHRVSSCTRNAPRPVVGSKWVWMGEYPPAVVTVTQVRWDSEGWRIGTRIGWGDGGTAWNDLTVFWEQCHAVAPFPGPTTKIGIRRGPPLPDEMKELT